MRMDVVQSDGEITSLDWYPRNYRSLSEETPVVFFCPGLFGISRDKYAYSFCQYAFKTHGWRSFVYHRRLILNEPIGEKLNSYVTNDDWRHVLNHIKSVFPKAPIYMVGVSMGALNIQRYLIDYSEDPIVRAAVAISSPWNARKISDHVLGQRLLLKLMLPAQIRMVRQHMHSEKFMEKMKSRGIDVEKVLAVKTNRDFDRLFSIGDLGLTHTDQYYDMLTAHSLVDKIKVPMLAINSMDDHLIPRCNIPEADIPKNPNIIQLLVAGGGHIEYFHSIKREFVCLV